MLDGRAAITTGAAGGLGRAMAETLLRAGQAGMVGLTKAWAKELAHPGVHVNAIQPGLIRTAMTAGLPSAVVAQIHEEQSSPLGAAIWYRVGDDVEPAGFVGELAEARS